MPMGITRVADQYGLLAESSAHREALAAVEAQARAIAATQRGHSITPGMNDPRRLQHFAAKGDFGGKKAPPFGSKPDDDDDDDKKDDKPWHEAGYGDGSGIDYDQHRRRLYGPDDVPEDEYSHESGYDPEGDWQDHRRTPIGPHVVGSTPRDRAHDTWASGRDRGDAEHKHHDLADDWDDGFGGWQTNMDDGTWGSDDHDIDRLGLDPDQRHDNYRSPGPGVNGLNQDPDDFGDDMYPTSSPGPEYGRGDKSWESGLDRPFVGGLDPDHTADPLMDPAMADPMYGGDPSYHDPVT